MQHAGAHVGQLADFGVGDFRHRPRLVHDARVRHQQARDIGPVFVEHRARRARGDRTAHIRAAAGERAHPPLRIASIEAGHDVQPVGGGQARAEQVPGLRIDHTIRFDHHALGRLDKLRAEPGRKQQRTAILATRRRVIGTHPTCQLRAKRLEARLDTRSDTKLAFDAAKTRDDLREGRGEIGTDARRMMAEVQQIGDLGIPGIALARSGRHDDPTPLIGLDDRSHLVELFGAGQARAAELAHDARECPCTAPFRRTIRFAHRNIPASFKVPMNGCALLG